MSICISNAGTLVSSALNSIFFATSSRSSILNSKISVGNAVLNLKAKCVTLCTVEEISSNFTLTYIDLPLTLSQFFISEIFIIPNIEYNFPFIRAFFAESKL